MCTTVTDGSAPARRTTLRPVRTDGWVGRCITEFLATVTNLPEPQTLLDVAVEHVGTAIDADCALIARGAELLTAWPSRDQIPPSLVAREGEQEPGEADVFAVPIAGPLQATLATKRATPPLDDAEMTLMRGMAKAIELSYAMMRTLEAERRLRSRSERQANVNAKLLASLRERQKLLEELSVVQHMISRREPLADILDAVVRSARDLLGADIVVVSRSPSVIARCGGAERTARFLARVAIPEDASDVDLSAAPQGIPLRQVIAAPVRENGRIVGAVLAGANTPRFRDADRSALLAFADHVSLAITDATTVEAMHRAFHDSLTGLASRALFLDRLEHGLAQAARSKTDLTLLFIDLDRFKIVNDTLGHAAGDLLLVEVANRLRHCLRASDTAARYGGDEFVVLLHDTDARGAAIVAARIIDAVRQPLTVAGMDVTVDASIGIACSTHGTVGADELLRSADVAMYRAKRAGRGRWAIYEPSMHAILLEQLHLETELRGALRRGEFVLHYQPIVRLATGTLFGAEALLRWRHPRRGLLSAADFVSMAEECGDFDEIAAWVLDTACRQARHWQERLGDDTFTITINVAASQLARADFAASIREAVDGAGLAPSSLVLDITEALVLRDEPWLLSRLEDLKIVGVSLAVDDFGARYSSLAGLPPLPLDLVKIDQAFIDAVGTPEGSAFARKIVELAHTLDLQVIAEGVQTHQQFEELRRARCEFAQGYLFAEPIEADAVPSLRANARRLWAAPARHRRN